MSKKKDNIQRLKDFIEEMKKGEKPSKSVKKKASKKKAKAKAEEIVEKEIVEAD